MGDYNLGTASGRIVVDGSPAELGFKVAQTAAGAFFDAVALRVESLQRMGKRFAAMGAAGVTGFGVAVKAASGFEHQMSGVKAVTSATEEQMESLRQKAQQLGRDTAFSAKESAGAMEELAKAGLSVEQIVNGAADAAVSLAAAGGVEMAEAASIASAAMNIFNIEGEEAARVADLFAGAANSSATDVSALGLSFEQVAPIASAVGFNIEETTTAIAAMAKAGITGGKAGTAMRATLVRLNPASAEAAKQMKKLGLITKEGGNEFFKANGDVKSMAQIAGILQKATADLSAEQKQQAFTTIFGQEAMSGALALAKEGKTGFDELSTAIEGVSAADVAATRLDNLSGSVTILKGSMETAMIVVGNMLLPALTKMINGITKLVNVFLNLPAPIQKVIVVLGLIASSGLLVVGMVLAMLPLLASMLANMLALRAIGAVTAAFKIFFTTLRAGTGAMAASSAAAATMNSRFGALIARMLLASKVAVFTGRAFLSMWAFITGPIGIAIAAIAALVAIGYVLYQRWEPFRNLVDQVAAVLQEKLKQAWVALQPAIKATSDALIRFGEFVRSTLLPVLKEVGGKILSRLIDAWGEISSAVVSELLPALQDLGDKVQNDLVPAVIDLWGFLQPLLATLGKWAAIVGGVLLKVVFELGKAWITYVMPILIKVAGFIAGVLIDTLVDLVKGVIGVVKGVIRIFSGLIDFFAGLFTGDWARMWEGIKSILSGALDLIIGAVRIFFAIGLLKLFSLGFRLLKALVMVGWRAILAVFKAAGAGIWSTVKFLFRFVWKIIRGYLNIYIKIIRAAWNFIRGIIGKSSNAIKGIISKVWSAIRGVISGRVNAIKGALSKAWGAIRSAASKAWERFKTIIGNKVKGAVEKVTGFVTSAKDAISGLGDDLLSAGSNLIKMLKDGLVAGIKKYNPISVVGGLASGIKDKFPGSPVEEGPLTSFNRGEAGKELMKLLTIGIEDGARMAIKSMARAADSIAGIATGINPQVVQSLDGPAPALTALTGASPRRSPQGSGRRSDLRLVKGHLSIDRSGRAWIEGIAEDVYEDETRFDDEHGGMG